VLQAAVAGDRGVGQEQGDVVELLPGFGGVLWTVGAV
jgi:hypothetical protein